MRVRAIFDFHTGTSLLLFGQLKLEGGQQSDEDGQHHAHGVGVAEVARLLCQFEGGPVDVIHHRVGPRAALGQQLNQSEALEGVDGGDDQNVQRGEK